MGKKWTAAEDATIKSNFWNQRAANIAALLPGRTTRAVHHRAKALGLFKSPQDRGRLVAAQWEADLSEQLGEPICDWLRRRYVDEQATYRELCAETSINTRSLMRLMRLCQIEPISPQEAVIRQIAANPCFLDALRTSASSPKGAIARANRRQQDWRTFCSENELLFLDSLQGAGLDPVPQLAVESFNIDFAFPTEMLAVELDPRWHRSPAKRPADRKKDEHLNALGWTILRLDARTSPAYNIRKVSDALTSLAAIQPR